jgi:hypothetical protein
VALLLAYEVAIKKVAFLGSFSLLKKASELVDYIAGKIKM